MTFKGPFQPKAFYDSMILIQSSPSSPIYKFVEALANCLGYEL